MRRTKGEEADTVWKTRVPKTPPLLMAADATVRAPLRREKSFAARSFDADGHLVHTLNTDESWSSAGRIRCLTLACSLTQVFAAVPAHTERGDGEQYGSQLKVGYARVYNGLCIESKPRGPSDAQRAPKVQREEGGKERKKQGSRRRCEQKSRQQNKAENK